MDQVVSRFLRYVSYNTRSDAARSCCPSSENQREFAAILRQEFEAMGLSSITLDKNGYLTACLPGNCSEATAIGFIAHLDTADYPADQVKPQLINHYQGGDIALGTSGEVLSPAMFPVLNEYIGQDLITTDGTTLLGADDKAGIAAILTAVAHLQADTTTPRGDIWIGITPDEEIGRGANLFPLDRFPAKWAYTIDGGKIGELEYENFNAATAKLTFVGNNTHPGTAKGIMVNSQTLAADFHSAMPKQETPECTEGYQGFFHLQQMGGSVEQSQLTYIVRDFSDEGFAARKAELERRVAETNQRVGYQACAIEIVDSYFNMRSQIEPVMHIVELAQKAMEKVGVKPLIQPIRGGTDGARLSFKGLPCPNIFTGGHNFHGKHEFIPVQSMQKSVETIVALAYLTANYRAV